ncbi:MAG: hypothetical protein ABEH88_12110 [Halobacteriales archaeon]
MTDLNVRAVATYEEFVQEWGDGDTRLLWQLLGQFDDDEVLIQIPEWLAEDKAGYVDGAPPTEVVGRIERETEKAILLDDSAAARPLMKLAHRIHELEQNEGDPERNDWLDDRLAEHRQAFESREDVPELADGWLPKSQLQCVVQRRD